MTDELFPILLTFDLDGESLALAADPASASRPGVLSTGRYGPTTGVYHLLAALESEGIPATFFVPGWIAERYPEAVEAIVKGGHEVAHHGYTHVSPADQEPEEERAALEKGIEILEKLTGCRPQGYRSPSWDFSDQTLELLQEYRFRYSSNFMDSDRPYLHPGDWASSWWSCLSSGCSMMHPFTCFAPHIPGRLARPTQPMSLGLRSCRPSPRSRARCSC